MAAQFPALGRMSPWSSSRDVAGPENSDNEQHQQWQGIMGATSGNTEVEPMSRSDFESSRQQGFTDHGVVTILTQEEALDFSHRAAHLKPHLPPYEISLWIAACFRGPKSTRRHRLCGFGVVHHRWDEGRPNSRDKDVTWLQSGFVVPKVDDIWVAEMLAVQQALSMAVKQCERISGTVVTKAWRKCEIEEVKRRAASIHQPLPKVVNVFTHSISVLHSLDPCNDSNTTPGRRSPLGRANTLIAALRLLGVQARLSWIPSHAGDIYYQEWLGPSKCLVCSESTLAQSESISKTVHRVERRRRKDKSNMEPSKSDPYHGKAEKQQSNELGDDETIVAKNGPSETED